MAALRRHWKKSTFGVGVLISGIVYATRKHRDKMVIRDFCLEAKKMADHTLSNQMDPVKRVHVFLNPNANNRKAQKHFRKYAEPILFSADLDVTVVTSIREGQIRKLMEFISPTTTDTIIIAGGDGTLFEVVNGLAKHHGPECLDKIPIVLIPLGSQNRIFRRLFPQQYFSSLPRRIGEATRTAIHSQKVKQLPLIELQPSSGDKVYVGSGVNWGAFKDAEENKNSFRFFGPLRLFFSYIKVAFGKWPTGFKVHFWTPELLPPLASQPQLSPPAPVSPAHPPPTAHTSLQTTSSKREGLSPSENSPDQLHSPSEEVHIPESLQPGTEKWIHSHTGIVGLNLREKNGRLSTAYWTDHIQHMDFCKQGWKADQSNLTSDNLGGESLLEPSLQPHSVSFGEGILNIQGSEESWISVDGEGFEAVPMKAQVLSTLVQIVSPHLP